jgi:CubicO group peptidase (beta-lactamase class C family)
MKPSVWVALLIAGCGADRSPPESGAAPPDLGSMATADAGGSELDDFVTAHMQTAQIPGLAAVVVKNDQVVLSRAWGLAEIESNRLATPDTLFMLASISKSVTAVALMQLVEKGQLTLDEPIDAKLGWQVRNPKFPDTPITARMLLSHTSGIEDGPRFGNYYVRDMDSPIALDAFLRGYLLAAGAYFDAGNWNGTAAPGTHYSYSNAGLSLAGNLLEKIAGMNLQDYCQQHVFGPLGMNESSFFLSGLDRTHLAMPYDVNTAGAFVPAGYYCYPDYPDGQLRTSANQLARFLMAFMQDGQLGTTRILEKASVDEMRKQQPASEEGLSWEFAPFGSRKLIGHSGADEGVSTDMYFEPATGAGFVVLANGLVFDDPTRSQALVEIDAKLLGLVQ